MLPSFSPASYGFQLSDDALKLQRDTFVYRAYLAQVRQCTPHHTSQTHAGLVQGKYSIIKSEIRADAAPELQAIKNAAAFLQSTSQRFALADLFCICNITMAALQGGRAGGI